MGSAPSPQPTATDLLFEACPFLQEHRNDFWECGDTIVFGDVARLLQRGQLPAERSKAVFEFFNALAEGGSDQTLEVLATGALETFNDNAEAQSMARRHLRGRALQVFEEMRMSWGQPDYGSEKSA